MSIEEVRGSLGIVADNIDGVSNGPMVHANESLRGLFVATATIHTDIHESLERAAEASTECEALSATGQVGHDDMEAQIGAVAAISASSGSNYLNHELPAKIRDLASRAEMHGIAGTLGTHLNEATVALRAAAAALLECTALIQSAYADNETSRGMMHGTAQEVRDYASGL